MGQKVHPTGIRLGIVKDWASKWYADSKAFPGYISADHEIRVYIKNKLKDASVSRISIERPANKVNITIHTARPGIVIGKKGEDIEKLRMEVSQMIGMPIQDVRINIAEVRKPELDAQLVAEGMSTREIASLLNVSIKTIESHRAQLMERVEIRDVPGLVRLAIREGLISSDH